MAHATGSGALQRRQIILSEESKMREDLEAHKVGQSATGLSAEVSSRERVVREIQLRFAPLVLRLRPEDEPAIIFSCR